MDSQVGTVCSILCMGYTCILPFVLDQAVFHCAPLPMFLMTIGGLIVGSKFGVLLNLFLGKRRVLVLFVILLFAEVARTLIANHVLTSLIHSPSVTM